MALEPAPDPFETEGKGDMAAGPRGRQGLAVPVCPGEGGDSSPAAGQMERTHGHQGNHRALSQDESILHVVPPPAPSIFRTEEREGARSGLPQPGPSAPSTSCSKHTPARLFCV